jgi:hypothetical protein
MKRRILILVLLVLFVIASLTAYAGLSFIGTARVSFGSVHGTVRIAGFGNDVEFVTVDMNVQGSNLTAFCQNKGGKQAPGQNPVSVNATVTSPPIAPTHNGNATIDMVVEVLPTVEAAGCPNHNWTVVDLIGTLHITFTAVDTSANPPATITQSLTCQIDSPAQTIDCVAD